MKLQINNINVSLDTKTDELKKIVFKKAGITESNVRNFKIVRRSVDARRGNVQFNYSVILDVPDNTNFSSNAHILPDDEKRNVLHGNIPLNSRPVIIGTGPCGLFCAYYLAIHGYRPIIFERGSDVETRMKKVENFNFSGILDTECNVQFGEGGAGTFSDGKLTTRIGSSICGEVLEIFHQCGAKDDILYEAKPHIGTDMLCKIIKNLREKITSLGGEFHFDSNVKDIKIRNGKVFSVFVSGNEIKCDAVVLAIGHSARDTYEMLYRKGVFIEPKAFAMGVRIEHKQEFINKSQYGKFENHPKLGSADYRLTYNGKDRSCFSFCMCPGGTVAAAASEENSVTVNGMSNNARNGENANSALVVSIRKDDYNGVLGGMELQRKLERNAFNPSSPYSAPAQNTKDYITGEKSHKITGVKPSYPLGVIPSDLNAILPEFINSTLKDGLLYFDNKIKGFTENSVLTGVETRTSAPIRITRNEDFESVNVKGLYPSGEGAGYAGGIMSSAVDGIKTAEKIIGKFKPFEGEI